jgi:hypothetical protein
MKELAQLREDVGRKSPHIHRNRFIAGEAGDLAGRVGVSSMIAVSFNASELVDPFKIAFGIYSANAARDRSKIGKRFAEDEADHCVIEGG